MDGNSAKSPAVSPPAAITGLLPPLPDSACPVATIKHATAIVQALVQHLNTGLVLILTADQPIYAVAKHIQWSYSTFLGGEHLIVIFSELNIENAILR